MFKRYHQVSTICGIKLISSRCKTFQLAYTVKALRNARFCQCLCSLLQFALMQTVAEIVYQRSLPKQFTIVNQRASVTVLEPFGVSMVAIPFVQYLSQSLKRNSEFRPKSLPPFFTRPFVTYVKRPKKKLFLENWLTSDIFSLTTALEKFIVAGIFLQVDKVLLN